MKARTRADLSDKIHTEGGSLCTLPIKGTSTCTGDSGGPLVDSGRMFVGVVSWGVLPCGYGPNIYTNVGHYVEWIKSLSPELELSR